ncbi:BRCA1-associated RING domain-containing protein [Cinnamomum micranthum f. kanehirae]|uniref:BRCA1-associated RING domain-containing protein n=1 Tax=Cinnamomum micranthum f. kanehirae TaxID=337451 RepID=A0A3S3NSP7_9MAGN|nr:BRCA1-associated RING domain-containing protein [Cinnamomum micranthum f. kanehirae]
MDGRQNSLVDEDCTREPKRQKKSKTLGFMTCLPVRFHTSENPVHKCEFCQASKESRVGELLWQIKQLKSNVLHANERCIEWGPRVYFAGETAVNLEAEVERAKKIKCNICAKKGGSSWMLCQELSPELSRSLCGG